ncbi:MAG: NfeD family protein [Firmicutes bacterium]|nr:NfeD family protein [Bacillota bacterium]MDD4692942.1 NfeD family protein [Bacillota bacterium]
MKRKIPKVILSVIISLMVVIPAFADVYLIPIKGDIDFGVAGFVGRALKEAERYKADVAIFEIDTLGGRVDAALEIRDSIMNATVPTITFVSGRAWSAGALIALSGEELYMVKSSSIGSAETIPKEEKTISAVRREFKATAEARGKDGRIAEAMVDSDVEIPDLSPKGKILNLTAIEATEVKISDGIVVNLNDLLEQKGFTHEDIVNKQPSGAEKFARFLTDPVVSSLLLTIGFLGIILEFFTAGWGAAGTVGIISLALFFGGRYLTGLAGLENVVLFIAGLIFLILEIFVIPGFGIVGILGIAGIFTSIVLSFENFAQAIWVLVAAIALTALAIKLLWKRLKKAPIMKKIILEASLDDQKGYSASSNKLKELEGKDGITVTVMRPSGMVEIESRRYSAQTDGEFLEKGIRVRVVEVQGNRIVVESIKE